MSLGDGKRELSRSSMQSDSDNLHR